MTEYYEAEMGPHPNAGFPLYGACKVAATLPAEAKTRIL